MKILAISAAIVLVFVAAGTVYWAWMKSDESVRLQDQAALDSLYLSSRSELIRNMRAAKNAAIAMVMKENPEISQSDIETYVVNGGPQMFVDAWYPVGNLGSIVVYRLYSAVTLRTSDNAYQGTAHKDVCKFQKYTDTKVAFEAVLRDLRYKNDLVTVPVAGRLVSEGQTCRWDLDVVPASYKLKGYEVSDEGGVMPKLPVAVAKN
jgi:hypothetical protein